MNAATLEAEVKAFIKSHAHACDICGATGMLVVGSTHSEEMHLSMRCMDHIEGIKQPFGISRAVLALDWTREGSLDRFMDTLLTSQKKPSLFWTPALDPHVVSPAACDDLAWFLANLERLHRVRPAMEGDPLFGEVDQVVVRRDARGFRRIPVPGGDELPDEEDYAAVLYEMAHRIVSEMAANCATGMVENQFVDLDLDKILTRVAVLRMCRKAAA